MKLDATALRAMSLEQLRTHWRCHCKGDMPQHGSRDLLVRAIIYQTEAATSGKAVRAVERRLKTARLAPGAALPRLLPGTVLVREWNGVPHAVTVTDDSLLWNGQSYASLSAVAAAITGVRWSGPRFFKLEDVMRAKSS